MGMSESDQSANKKKSKETKPLTPQEEQKIALKKELHDANKHFYKEVLYTAFAAIPLFLAIPAIAAAASFSLPAMLLVFGVVAAVSAVAGKVAYDHGKEAHAYSEKIEQIEKKIGPEKESVIQAKRRAQERAAERQQARQAAFVNRQLAQEAAATSARTASGLQRSDGNDVASSSFTEQVGRTTSPEHALT